MSTLFTASRELSKDLNDRLKNHRDSSLANMHEPDVGLSRRFFYVSFK